MEGDEFGEAFGFQRAGVGDEVDALDDREPEGDGAAERVEQRQAAENGRAHRQIEPGAELGDVGQHVAVAEHHAFRLAGGAGGEEQRGLVIAAAFVEPEQRAEHRGGQQFGEDGPGDDLLLEGGQDALDENEIAVRRPREGGNLADEGIGGDEAVHAGLADARADGFGAGGEVEVDRGFAGEEHGEIGDESGFAGRQDDGHPRLVGFLSDDLGKGDGGRQHLVVGQLRIVRPIEDAVFRAVFFQAFEQGHGERALEQGPRTEGLLGGFQQRLVVGRHAGIRGGDRFGDRE